MSRSRKKRAVTGTTTARSDKSFKVAEHRRERRAVSALLPVTQDDSDRRLHSKRHGDPWLSPKDGKSDWTGSDYEPKALRK